MADFRAMAQVIESDVRAAQTLLDELEQVAADTHTAAEYRLKARGVLAGWAADVREAGHIAGKLEGRRQVAGWVRDALAGEGL